LTKTPKWKKGDTWELSVTASAPLISDNDIQVSRIMPTKDFHFKGKGGFLKISVPFGAVNQRITVQDTVKRKGRSRFVYLGKGDAGLVTFTDICLRKVGDGDGNLPVVVEGPAPVTTCLRPVAPGSTILPVASQEGFAIDQEVVLDEGGPNEEYDRISGFGSLIFQYPLQYDHGPGAVIKAVRDEEDYIDDAEEEGNLVFDESGNPVMDASGATASLDAAGFFAVTSLCCPWQMEVFFNRLLDKMGLYGCSKPHIQGLMHWFHCVPDMDFQYIIDVINNGNPCKFWHVKGQECPVLSPACQGRWCR